MRVSKALPNRFVPQMEMSLLVPSEWVPVVVMTTPLLYVKTRCFATLQVRVALSANWTVTLLAEIVWVMVPSEARSFLAHR
jgi:hypothetical protein